MPDGPPLQERGLGSARAGFVATTAGVQRSQGDQVDHAYPEEQQDQSLEQPEVEDLVHGQFQGAEAQAAEDAPQADDGAVPEMGVTKC